MSEPMFANELDRLAWLQLGKPDRNEPCWLYYRQLIRAKESASDTQHTPLAALRLAVDMHKKHSPREPKRSKERPVQEDMCETRGGAAVIRRDLERGA